MRDEVDVVPVFPPRRNPAHPLDPPAEVVGWLSTCPVKKVRVWNGVEAWLVTRFDDARFAFSDDAFSVDPRKPGFPEKNAAYSQVLGQDRNLRTMDMPEHQVQRRMLNRDFTVKSVENMRPAIQQKIDSLTDAMLKKGSPSDIVADLAVPVPQLVICELLGIPYEDRDYFTERALICLGSQVPETAAAAGQDLYRYIDTLLDRKDESPQDDLLSRLVVEQLRTGRLSRKDIVELARFLLIAGHDTTATTIALGTVALLQHPDQLAELTADPSLVENAVEEILRFVSPTHLGRRRVTVKDVVLGGCPLKSGEGVIIANHVADRDPAKFPNPDRFDIHRANAEETLAFGSGIHQCLAQRLARAEVQMAITALVTRFPNLRLAVPLSELRFNEEANVISVASLPVEWG
jgi:cytochrome P450